MYDLFPKVILFSAFLRLVLENIKILMYNLVRHYVLNNNEGENYG